MIEQQKPEEAKRMTAAKTLTPKELAEAMGTDAKTLRKFLREWFKENELETPGQGGRYAITAADAKKIRKAFATQVAAPKAPPAAEAEVIDEAEGDEIEDLSDLEGPADEELDDEDEGDLDFEDIDEV